MTPQSEHIIQLLMARLRGDLNEDGRLELDAWRQANSRNELLYSELTDVESLSALLRKHESYNKERIAAYLQQQFPEFQLKPVINRPAPVHRIHFLRTAWFRVAVAVVIIFAGVFTYYRMSDNGVRRNNTIATTSEKEILPGNNKAILTLSDGKKVQLNPGASETINDNNVSIKNFNGQLEYITNGTYNPAVNPLSMNTMVTPRGGQYQLILPDGSKVWLNAESSITFPTAFTGNRREVSVTGEMYFEIKADKAHPFIVRTAKENISVLGTSFNVNAYANEENKISLVTGAIKVNNNLLRPGQASVNGKIISTNLARDLAWRNGAFSFDNADIKMVMRQLSRWYDIEVQYAGELPADRLTGEMGRNLTLNQVMILLSQNKFDYSITNKTITILPKTKR